MLITSLKSYTQIVHKSVSYRCGSPIFANVSIYSSFSFSVLLRTPSDYFTNDVVDNYRHLLSDDGGKQALSLWQWNDVPPLSIWHKAIIILVVVVFVVASEWYGFHVVPTHIRANLMNASRRSIVFHSFSRISPIANE